MLVRGHDLEGTTAVDFASTPAILLTIDAGGQELVVVAPPHVAGTVDVTVTNPESTSGLTFADEYTYLVPTVTSVSSASGPVSGGNTVTVFGHDLQGTTAVDFGSTPATSVMINSTGTALTAVAPAHAAGTVDVTVTNAEATSTSTAADGYTFMVPVVTSVAPSSGPLSGGTTVTVFGHNLEGTTTVFFDSGQATSVAVNAAGTEITAVSPPHTAGTVLVVVAVSEGATSGLTGSGRFTYLG